MYSREIQESYSMCGECGKIYCLGCAERDPTIESLVVLTAMGHMKLKKTSGVENDLNVKSSLPYYYGQ